MMIGRRSGLICEKLCVLLHFKNRSEYIRGQGSTAKTVDIITGWIMADGKKAMSITVVVGG